MAATAFSLIGMISLKGVEDVTKHLTKMDKQVRKVQREMGKFGRKLENTGKTLTKAFTVPLIGMSVALVKGVKDASDLSETIAKAGEVFGSASADVEKWAGNTAVALGQSKTQAIDAAANFAIFGKAAGLTGKTLTSFSTDFVALASDLASFNNTSPEEAITAIGSALRGENEPMRRFGVLLNDATMRQEALKMGLIATTKKALTPQTKILVAQSLVYKQTKDAQGDFARTSAGLANQQRILAAEVKNMSAELGSIFLPIATKVFGVLRKNVLPVIQKITNWFKNLSVPMQKTIMMWGVLLVAVGPVVMLFGKLIVAAKVLVPLIKLLTFSQGALNAVMAANPIGIVVVAIVALIAAGIALYNNWATVSAFLTMSWQAFVNVVVLSVSHIKELFFNALTAYLALAESMTTFIPFLGEKVTALKKKFQALADKERAARAERNQASKDTAVATEVLTEYDATVTQVTEDIAVLGEQESQMATQRMELEQAWSDKYTELTQSRAEALILEKDNAIAEAERVGAETDTIEAFYQEKELQRLRELTDKRIAFEQTWSDKVFEMSATRLEQMTKEKEEALKNAEEVGADTTAIKQFYRLEAVKIEKEKQDAIKAFETERTKEYKAYLQDKKEKDIQASLDVITKEEEWNDAHKELIELRKEEIEKEREHAILTAEKVGAEKTDIDKLYDEKLITLSKASYVKRKEFEEKLLQKKVKTWEKGLSSFADIAGQIGDLVHEYYDTEIALAEDKLKKQIKGVKNSKMSEKDKAKAIQDLEKGTYDKVRAIKTKQAKQDKKMAIFNVIIATALAIMKVAASAPGFFIRIAAIAAIAALGIVQIALIKRRPLPTFAKGGGVKGNRGGIEAQVGEGKETELIFPLKTGVAMLMDNLMSRISSFKAGMSAPPGGGLFTAPAGGSLTLNVGTLVADDAGIKKLERAMRKFRIQENQRRGYNE